MAIGISMAVVAIAVIGCASSSGGVASPSPSPAAPTTSASRGQVATVGTPGGGSLPQALAGLPGGDAANLISGTIASTAPGYITVSTQRGPLRLAVDDTTRATSVLAAARDDMKVGQDIAASGQRSEDGTVMAQVITLDADRPQQQAVGLSGTSTAGVRTRFLGPGGQPGRPGSTFGEGPMTPEQADRLVEQAVASGRLSPEQAADLRSRLLGTPGPGPLADGTPRATVFRQAGPVFGRVTSIDGDRVTIESGERQFQIAITSETVIRRVTRVSATELPAGTAVSVAAERGADGVVRATAIFLGAPALP